MRVIVCGGRYYPSYSDFCLGMRQAIELCIHPKTIGLIIQGGAKGADDMAKRWAAGENIECLEISADWSLGPKAGPLRNKRMLDEGKPDLVIAFTGGRGTADMIRRAKAANIDIVYPDNWPIP